MPVEREVECGHHGTDIECREGQPIALYHAAEVRLWSPKNGEGAQEEEAAAGERESELLRPDRDHGETDREGQEKENGREDEEGAKHLEEGAGGIERDRDEYK